MTHVINLNYDINRACIHALETESIGYQSSKSMLTKGERKMLVSTIKDGGQEEL